jgi:hypothetical protein
MSDHGLALLFFVTHSFPLAGSFTSHNTFMSESAQVHHWQENCHQPDKENPDANHAYDLMYPSFDEQSADPIDDRQDNR